MDMKLVKVNDTVYIHGTIPAKIVEVGQYSAIVEYLTDSLRVKKGAHRKVLSFNIQVHKQLFDKKNRLIGWV